MDSRIRIYHKKNGDLSLAQDHGLRYVIGELLMFFDPDEWLDFNKRCENPDGNIK